MKAFREGSIRVYVAWQRFKSDQKGAQTLEWLALALLILAVLGTVSAAASKTEFGDTLRTKFMNMVNKVDSTTPAP